ncbi:unnamed protein product, partial [Discosporangium mesarthrocarpum]
WCWWPLRLLRGGNLNVMVASCREAGLAMAVVTCLLLCSGLPCGAFVGGWAPPSASRLGNGLREVKERPLCTCGTRMSAGQGLEGKVEELKRAGVGLLAGLLVSSGVCGQGAVASASEMAAPTSSVTVEDLQKYDGFEDYAAQGKQMEDSDVGCFANECKRETASCFTDGSCLKGVTCLGRCKGEQECATRCFAQYGSEKLDSWLTCTLEDHSCVKIPKDMDFSVIDKDPPKIVRSFDAKALQGTWYKVMGVNKKYDCFDCQRNTFAVTDLGGEDGGQVASIRVNFRLAKPDSSDFWENTINEKLEVDPVGSPRTFHTKGKLFGLTFKENWYVTGLSDDPGSEFVFVQYKGHTLQGSYEGSFVYARKPTLPSGALAKVSKVAREHGIDPESLTPIDNTCSSRPSLPRAGDTAGMNMLERVSYEAAFVYDLMEWVHPGTIHKYAKGDQKTKVADTTIANTK